MVSMVAKNIKREYNQCSNVNLNARIEHENRKETIFSDIMTQCIKQDTMCSALYNYNIFLKRPLK